MGIFAYDIVLWSSGPDTEKVEEGVNLVLVDAWSFAVNHKLSFSPSKSTVGFFTTNRKLYNFRPRIILEYGFPIFCCSSDSNLQKRERVQLSAARITTGLRNSCLKDIVLYKADLQPLSLRRNTCLVKYYGKLSGLGFQNRTSKFLWSWNSHQRLKRGIHVGHVVSGHFVASSIEHTHHSLSQIIDASEGLQGVYFHVDLSIQVSKQKELPCYLKQLALERINNVPKDAVHMYTDGSKLGSDCSGSSIYISFREQEIKIQRKNPDSCSVFRSELVAILEGLNSIESLSQLYDIWIVSDSRSAIQHLAI
ncbi:RNase H domain-containing protein [Trichonephila clavipes]|nr:RNase H domain-containing protein [Trichonephila clavipes]